MLSDPISVTYNGSAKSLARTSSWGVGDASGTRYASSGGAEFRCNITETKKEDTVRVEVLLERTEIDIDPLNGYQYVPNRFGFVYEFNRSQYNTSTDIPLLRSALIAFVDSTLQGRLIGGEK